MSEIKDQSQFVLPPNVVTKADVSRLVSEMERLDNEVVTRDAHIKANVPITEQITLSEQLSDFLSANDLEIGDNAERAELIKQLRHLKSSVPTVHVTFATSADGESLRQIVGWLRQSIHPQSVVAVGLQPSLIGGAYIRTPNHVHDFSLRARLAGHRDIITKEVEAIRGGK